MNATETFRENVLVAIEDRGLSLSEIARRAGISRTALSNFLHCMPGKEGITLDRANKIAEIIGLPISELLSTESPQRVA